MNIKRTAAAVLGAGLLAGTVVPVQAQAAAGSTTAVCGTTLGSFVAGPGDHKFQRITATSPVTAATPTVGPTGLFPGDRVKLASSLRFEPDPPSGVKRGGYVTLGSDLYGYEYDVDQSTGAFDRDSFKQWKLGGGWGLAYTYLEESRYSDTAGRTRTNTYALHDGVINRWTVDGRLWRNKATYAGFSSVKTMTLISQTPTYDSFLANTRGGALYTIRIPVSGTPVVKRVRTSTWQSFDVLIADRCGSQSTLLIGIDKDVRTAYLYAVGHANGTATVIKGLGQVGQTFAAFPDDNYFRYYGSTPTAPKLYGE
ncbi:hypothetical protein [Kribbella sp. NPDC004875]|uniref:hypothetical protein n=1 Tax=Kribbella sp. NPDC004875 TaxID=3364107 RepID=UPI0036942E24